MDSWIGVGKSQWECIDTQTHRQTRQQIDREAHKYTKQSVRHTYKHQCMSHLQRLHHRSIVLDHASQWPGAEILPELAEEKRLFVVTEPLFRPYCGGPASHVPVCQGCYGQIGRFIRGMQGGMIQVFEVQGCVGGRIGGSHPLKRHQTCIHIHPPYIHHPHIHIQLTYVITTFLLGLSCAQCVEPCVNVIIFK